MKKIIFVCHGNICRSPAAELIAKELVRNSANKSGFQFLSRAMTHEEIGNDIYPPMKRVLTEHHIPLIRHEATYLLQQDYDWADYLFYMDEENKEDLERRFPFDFSVKIKPINLYTPSIREIEDPWYSGRYELVYTQLEQCVKDILAHLKG